jgi:hypothetical protein
MGRGMGKTNHSADGCPCSQGCQSLWPCTPSQLCWQLDPPPEVEASLPMESDVTFLLFLAFNSSLVRNAFHNHPHKAREREMNRILWFVHTAKAVDTRVPIHVAVAGERDAKSESRLLRAGVRLLEGPLVPTPRWASKWHRLSFNKIAALSFTQFRKVVVLDNDAGLLMNIDAMVRSAPTPSAVFHATIGSLAMRTRCAVTTGLLVLRPSIEAYARARILLDSMTYQQEQYDGGDEEFWLRYFNESSEPLYELPWRYHAHRLLPMNATEWGRVRMMHLINALAGRGWHIPRNLTWKVERYW